MDKNKYIPFVEKYRPNNFESLVLNDINKKIFHNIIETGNIPNLLLYGLPGSGKTSTIVNFIKLYQEKYNQKNSELVIHLNASDDRGIETIRNQIHQFVSSKSLFSSGTKFVILDEADSMTKTAQQTLRYLLQNYYSGVRFCLICNYISKIDEGLRNEFICLRYNQLKEEDIIKFLNNINKCENLNLSIESLKLIQKKFNNDIRSMINFMQSNHNSFDNFFIDEKTFEEFYSKIKTISKNNDKKNNHCIDLTDLNAFIDTLSEKYKIDKKWVIKDFIGYLIKNHEEIITKTFLNMISNIIHIQDCKNTHYINYFLLNFIEHVSKFS